MEKITIKDLKIEKNYQTYIIQKENPEVEENSEPDFTDTNSESISLEDSKAFSLTEVDISIDRKLKTIQQEESQSREDFNKICQQGEYKNIQTQECSPCPTGTFKNIAGNEEAKCLACPAGYFQANIGSSSCSPCLASYFCSGKSISAKGHTNTDNFENPVLQVFIAQQQPPLNLRAKQDTTAHKEALQQIVYVGLVIIVQKEQKMNLEESQEKKMKLKKICKAGYYCSEGAKDEYGRQANEESEEQKKLCQAGYYCPRGSYTITGKTSSDVNDKRCPLGHYCLAGANSNQADNIKTFACPPGSFTSNEGQDEATDCQACTAGQICPGIQDDGSYQGPQTCPAGYYCEGLVNGVYKGAQACPEGTLTKATGRTSADQCEPCSAGFYCPKKASNKDSDKLICPAGFYCLEGASTSTADNKKTFACPAGFYCLEGARSSTADNKKTFACPAGFYCLEGASTSTADNNKTFTCPAGFYCLEGASSSTADNKKTFACPAGFYCPQKTSNKPTPTNPSPNGMNLICPAGFYCLEGASSSTADNNKTFTCPAGFYCPQGTSAQPSSTNLNVLVISSGNFISKNLQCPQGSYCSAESKNPTFCPAGSFNSNIRQASINNCQRCNPGFYCPQGTTANPNNTSRNVFIASLQQSIDLSCPAGFYCPSGTQSKPNSNSSSVLISVSPLSSENKNLQCPKGAYCPAKSENPTLCPAGTYNNQIAQSEITACQFCQAGFYCLEGASSAIADNNKTFTCPAGFYCPQGTSQEPNDANSNIIATNKEDYSQQDLRCPQGSYCLAGSAYHTSCPVGTYNGAIKQTLLNNCLKCKEGVFCEEGASSDLPEQSDKTRVCDKNIEACPRGTKAPIAITFDANSVDYLIVGNDIHFYCKNDYYNIDQAKGTKEINPYSSSQLIQCTPCQKLSDRAINPTTKHCSEAIPENVTDSTADETKYFIHSIQENMWDTEEGCTLDNILKYGAPTTGLTRCYLNLYIATETKFLPYYSKPYCRPWFYENPYCEYDKKLPISKQNSFLYTYRSLGVLGTYRHDAIYFSQIKHQEYTQSKWDISDATTLLKDQKYKLKFGLTISRRLNPSPPKTGSDNYNYDYQTVEEEYATREDINDYQSKLIRRYMLTLKLKLPNPYDFIRQGRINYNLNDKNTQNTRYDKATREKTTDMRDIPFLNINLVKNGNKYILRTERQNSALYKTPYDETAVKIQAQTNDTKTLFKVEKPLLMEDSNNCIYTRTDIKNECG